MMTSYDSAMAIPCARAVPYDLAGKAPPYHCSCSAPTVWWGVAPPPLGPALQPLEQCSEPGRHLHAEQVLHRERDDDRARAPRALSACRPGGPALTRRPLGRVGAAAAAPVPRPPAPPTTPPPAPPPAPPPP